MKNKKCKGRKGGQVVAVDKSGDWRLKSSISYQLVSRVECKGLK